MKRGEGDSAAVAGRPPGYLVPASSLHDRYTPVFTMDETAPWWCEVCATRLTDDDLDEWETTRERHDPPASPAPRVARGERERRRPHDNPCPPTGQATTHPPEGERARLAERANRLPAVLCLA